MQQPMMRHGVNGLSKTKNKQDGSFGVLPVLLLHGEQPYTVVLLLCLNDYWDYIIIVLVVEIIRGRKEPKTN